MTPECANERPALTWPVLISEDMARGYSERATLARPTFWTECRKAARTATVFYFQPLLRGEKTQVLFLALIGVSATITMGIIAMREHFSPITTGTLCITLIIFAYASLITTVGIMTSLVTWRANLASYRLFAQSGLRPIGEAYLKDPSPFKGADRLIARRKNIREAIKLFMSLAVDGDNDLLGDTHTLKEDMELLNQKLIDLNGHWHALALEQARACSVIPSHTPDPTTHAPDPA